MNNIITNSFNIIHKIVPYLFNEINNKFLFNKIISKNYKNLNISSFEGKLSCGACCYVLHYYLKKHNINTKIMKSIVYDDEYKLDHCYLLYNNSVIIDPTYKQFYSSSINKIDPFSSHLFFELPFVFIGKHKDLNKLHNDLDSIHKKMLNKSLDIDILNFWKNPTDITHISDLEIVIKDSEYAKNKGKLFLNIHKNYDITHFQHT